MSVLRDYGPWQYIQDLLATLLEPFMENFLGQPSKLEGRSRFFTAFCIGPAMG